MAKSPRKKVADSAGSNPQPPDHKSDAHPTGPPRPTPQFAITDESKFRDGRVNARNLGMNGLNRYRNIIGPTGFKSGQKRFEIDLSLVPDGAVRLIMTG